MPKLFTRVEENPVYIECYEQYGEIGLRLVDEKGKPINNGDFLKIQKDGTLYLYYDVDKEAAQKAGLDMLYNGKIRLSD